jgi:hypothetical protein
LHHFWNLAKAQALYLHGYYSKALSYIELSEKDKNASYGTVVNAQQHFVHGLIIGSILSKELDQEKEAVSLTEEEHDGHMKVLEANWKHIQQLASDSHFNFVHCGALLEAEVIRGKLTSRRDCHCEETIIRLYDLAISKAKAERHVTHEAIAEERLTGFMHGVCNMSFVAGLSYREAEHNYTRWGVKPKIELLQQKYPQFVVTDPTTSTEGVTLGSNSSDPTSTNLQIDLTSILKASQAISSSLELSKLLKTLMQVLVQNAAADKGVLILHKDNQWVIEAEMDGDKLKVLQGIPLQRGIQGTKERCPQNLIEFVAQTGESVVLENASAKGSFMEDKYIRERGTKSVLCFPLVSGGKNTAIVYLVSVKIEELDPHEQQLHTFHSFVDFAYTS